MEEKKETFSYSYSSEQQKEIREIREKYMPKEESKMDLLRKLDESAAKPGMILSLIMGIIGTLFLCVGMCCTMVWAETWFIPGIVIGVFGLLVIAFAYPVYTRVTKWKRPKIAPQIMKLTDELMK